MGWRHRHTAVRHSTNLSLALATCTVAGIRLTFDCDDALADALIIALTTGNVTPLLIAELYCQLRAATGCTATLDGGSGAEGSIRGSFSNTGSRLTIDAPTGSNQTLVVSGSTCTSIIPNGTVTISGVSNGALPLGVTPAQTVTAS